MIVWIYVFGFEQQMIQRPSQGLNLGSCNPPCLIKLPLLEIVVSDIDPNRTVIVLVMHMKFRVKEWGYMEIVCKEYIHEYGGSEYLQLATLESRPSFWG